MVVAPHLLMASPRRLLLIRHGHTLSVETGLDMRDDPLSHAGRAQALHAAASAALAPVTLVLVSPLARALETALLMFSARPDVTLHITPALREFNFRQREGEPLRARHVGTPLGELRARFPASSAAACTIRWDEELERAPDAWWEPHGSAYAREGEAPAAPTACDRAYALLERLHGGAFACSGPLALVAHENVFRAMTGVPRFRHACVEGAVLHASALLAGPRPLLVHMDALVALPSPALLAGGAGARPVPLRHVFAVLGCASHAVYSARAATAFAAASAHAAAQGGAAPLVLGLFSPAELLPAIEDAIARVASGALPPAAPHTAILMDMQSRTTRDNALRALVQLEALSALAGGCKWVLHLVTSDWHMPRSLAVFWEQMAAAGARSVLALRAVPSPVPLTTLRHASTLDKHLLDARHHLDFLKGDGSSDALRQRIVAVGGWDALLAVGRNLRVHEGKQGSAGCSLSVPEGTLEALLRAVRRGKPAHAAAAEAGQTANAASASAARAEVHALLQALFFPAGRGAPGIVAPSLRIHSNGSTLLHFAASYGMEGLCLDLCTVWGHAAGAANDVGLTPAQYAARAGFGALAQVLEDAAAAQALQEATLA